MKTSVLIAFVLSLQCYCFASPQNSEGRPLELQAGSQFRVPFSAELLEKGEISWTSQTPSVRKRCSLSIRSHFDEELARQMGSAIYSIKSVNNVEGQSLVDFQGHEITDQFSLSMSTENKDLPLMMLDCYLEAPRVGPVQKWTLANVESLIQHPGFFVAPQFESAPQAVAVEVIDSWSSVQILVPIRFAAIQNGNGLSLQNPIFQNGRVLTQAQPGSSCSASYQTVPSFKLEPYDVTLQPGEEFRVEFLTETRNSYYFRFIHRGGGFALDAHCFFSAGEFRDFSSIEAHLNSIFEIRRGEK